MNLVAYLKAFDEEGNWSREKCKEVLISARSSQDALKNQKKKTKVTAPSPRAPPKLPNSSSKASIISTSAVK